MSDAGCWKLDVNNHNVTSGIRHPTSNKIKSKDNKKTTQKMSSFYIVNKVPDYFFK